MLALSHQHGLAQHTITMVAALSMQEVLLETPIGNVCLQFSNICLHFSNTSQWARKYKKLQAKKTREIK